MNQTQYNLTKKKGYIERLPVSALGFICHGFHGWIGWCPLNQKWAAAQWDLGYQLFPTLRKALNHIKWHHGDQSIHFVHDRFDRIGEVIRIDNGIFMLLNSRLVLPTQRLPYNPHAQNPITRSCPHSCSPSDFTPTGKCAEKGCYYAD